MKPFMQGVNFVFDSQAKAVNMIVDVDQLSEKLSVDACTRYFKSGKYQSYFLLDEALATLIDSVNNDIAVTSTQQHQAIIAQALDAQMSIVIASDKLSASISISAPCGGDIPSVASVIEFCHSQGVLRGISSKRVGQVLQQVNHLSIGESVTHTIAKGLPVKHGQESQCIPLVKNALERILQPTIDEHDKADMRDLGDIFTVSKDTPIARFQAATIGRDGYTVEDKAIKAKPGKTKPINMEDGVRLSDREPNLVIADRAGMPKFDGVKVRVDDVFVTNGVNVGTGNIEYKGAVIVNGDVADRMRVIATGDITINGFVESAYIETQGDIIITQGAAGQTVDSHTDPNCILRAQGNIVIENAQGVDIICAGDLIVRKQLAFSKIESKGSIFVGKSDKPDGSIIGCHIYACGEIKAGTIGATSGSHISIDYTAEYKAVLDSANTLKKQYNALFQVYEQHQTALLRVKQKILPEELQQKIHQLTQAVIKEKQLLNWVKEKLTDNEIRQTQFPHLLNVIATHTLHSGVSIKLNNTVWKSQQQFGPTKVSYHESKWQAEPFNPS